MSHNFFNLFHTHEPFLDEKYGKNQEHEVSRIPLKTNKTMSKIPTIPPFISPLPQGGTQRGYAIHRAEFSGPTRLKL